MGTIAQENLWLAMDWLNVLLLISMLIAVTGGVPAKQKPQDEDCPQVFFKISHFSMFNCQRILNQENS